MLAQLAMTKYRQCGLFEGLVTNEYGYGHFGPVGVTVEHERN